MMAPKVDMPNYNESIDQIDYKRLVLLCQKSTATTYVDRAALANEEEATIRILKPEETDKTARQLLLGLDGKTMTVFSFTMEEYVAMIAEQEGTLTLHPRWCPSWQTMAPDNRGPHNPGRSKSAVLARVKRTHNAIVKHSDGGNSVGPQQLVLPSHNEARQFIPAWI